MTNTVTVEEAKARLEDLITRTACGEEFLITDTGGQPVARLAASGERWLAFGMMKGQIEMAPDFDEPLEEFKPYME